MSKKRIVFVVRSFWPHWDGASRSLGSLAAALVERGWTATIVTTQLYAPWPSHFFWRGVSVVRLPWDRSSRRGQAQYLRSLGRWFRQHRNDYDLAYVSGLRHDACEVLDAVKGSMRVVLRGESAGREGDCLWHLETRGGKKIKRTTTRASAWIGPSLAVYHELVAAGYDRDRTFYIASGVAPRPPREEATRLSARRELAADRPALMLSEQTLLAVYVGQIRRGRGLSLLIDAWEKVVVDHPKARLWLIGYGPECGSTQQQIDSRGLANRVTLVGRFDEIDTVLDAADLFVLPAAGDNRSMALLEAMAAELPIVALDNHGNRELVESGRQGLLAPPGDSMALAAALGRLFGEPALAARLAAAARRRAETDFSLVKMVDEHVTLFENLL